LARAINARASTALNRWNGEKNAAGLFANGLGIHAVGDGPDGTAKER
jgi:hypothetical protein